MGYLCPNCQRPVAPRSGRRWFQIVPRTTTADCPCGARPTVFARTYAWWFATGVMKPTFALAGVAVIAYALVKNGYEPRHLGEMVAYALGCGAAAAVVLGLSLGAAVGFLVAAVKRLAFVAEDIFWLAGSLLLSGGLVVAAGHLVKWWLYWQ